MWLFLRDIQQIVPLWQRLKDIQLTPSAPDGTLGSLAYAWQRIETWTLGRRLAAHWEATFLADCQL
jgi:hypothetical protein